MSVSIATILIRIGEGTRLACPSRRLAAKKRNMLKQGSAQVAPALPHLRLARRRPLDARARALPILHL